MLYNLMKYIRYTIQMYHVKKTILIIYIGVCAYGMLSYWLASNVGLGNPSRASAVSIAAAAYAVILMFFIFAACSNLHFKQIYLRVFSANCSYIFALDFELLAYFP